MNYGHARNTTDATINNSGVWRCDRQVNHKGIGGDGLEEGEGGFEEEEGEFDEGSRDALCP